MEKMRKIYALVMMLVLCASAVSAYDLGDYPGMLISGDELNAVIVVGDQAPSSDIVGAVDIGASLQHYTSTEQTATSAGTIDQISVGAARLASEVINNMDDYNMIVVGNPCNNAVAYELLGHPYTCKKGFTEGEGRIKLIEMKYHIYVLVAGYTDDDTRRATRVLSDPNHFKLDGDEVCVYGTFSDPIVMECASPVTPTTTTDTLSLRENCKDPFGPDGLFRDSDGDGCHAGTDSDCGGIEGVDDPKITCFNGKDDDCDGMIDARDNDLSCNLKCGDGICGWYEKITNSQYYCKQDCGTQQTTCRDSDGGVNYNLKGTVYFNGQQYTDFCYNYDANVNSPEFGNCEGSNGCVLVEHSCTSYNSVNKQKYDCPGGCRDGACIKSTVQYQWNEKWIQQDSEVTFELDNKKHQVGVVDVSDQEDQCGIDLDGEIIWVRKGDTEIVNGVKIQVRDMKKVSGQLQDRDKCLVGFYGSIREEVEIDIAISQRCPLLSLPQCKDGERVETYYVDNCPRYRCVMRENQCPLPSRPKCIDGKKLETYYVDGCPNYRCIEPTDINVCPTLWDPVCGVDGRTYPNDFVGCGIPHGVQIACRGECPCKDDELQCGTGCPAGTSCLPIGTRLVHSERPSYCDIDNQVKSQKAEQSSCQNNYECLSNQCSNGHCVDLERELKETRGMMEKILGWLGRLFK